MSKLKKCLYLINLLERLGPMSLKEINEHYQYSSIYEGVDFQPRTFARYKDFIQASFPCHIEYDQSTRRYSLVHDKGLYSEDDSLYDYLLSAYHIEGMTELALKHRDKIMLTPAPTGVECVQTVLQAIDQSRGIIFDYWSFNKDTKKHQAAIPYFLRTWEGRWYLVAEPDNHHHGLSIYALERMDNLQLTDEKMTPTHKVTVKEYFEGSFGANHIDKQHPETIRIKAYGSQVNYIRALPIHESQKEIETTSDWSIFEYHIVPCYNLYQQLLWHREKIEILEPTSMRNQMKTILSDICKHYNI